MGMFNRKPKKPSGQAKPDPIEEFWQWWERNQHSITDAIEKGTLNDYVEPLTGRVQAIDPRLAFEFGPGVESQHQLTVTAEGDPSARSAARRWLNQAPAADTTWSFFDMRQAAAVISKLHIFGHTISLRDIQVATEPTTTGLSVGLYHPVFSQLSEAERTQLTFIALDHCLGEEVVSIWLDGIDALPAPPAESVDLSELPGIVAEVRKRNSNDEGISWLNLKGETPQGPVVVSVLGRLNSAVNPHLDHYVGVTVGFQDAHPVYELEDKITAMFSGHGMPQRGMIHSGMMVASEVLLDQRLRTMHFYVDSTTDLEYQIRAVVQQWRDGEVLINAEYDPGWHNVQHLRV
ncbi:hypothetical protein [Corynebacterium cystitidis]|uniref:DUF695 domain-containing protein n=1 Tax=Corynebacterium cystitidis DSM 20524 TaxID=1121357 RepID=A0A1H9RBM8_9CORY|nr:hypothetical protein [Corynebacterium cystitidis]WJY81489.1 hypothetical protein CCYS_02580 [Corynebacterium cystitidis DSM 20524]SER70156.1 hypothetical protein SAMN05661109_00842 [Corynebacterium cystitidis DSM 20524]SNV87000.1 Uncharacterised protein [Corynebacterium cystitidis]